MEQKNPKNLVRAVGLVSGGLDSALAAKIIKDLNVDVYGIHFVLPWCVEPSPSAVSVSQQIGIPLKVHYFKDDFLNIVRNPKHGYGSAINPCVDCKIHQLRNAKIYMEELGADFVFTGEVLGQRPMSQMRNNLERIEKESGLEGLLLRPLSAKLLDPTIVEQSGKINREKLFDFSGRSRSDLLALGRKFNIKDYIPTGGGCLLTDKNFAKRLGDSFTYGYRDQNDIISLKWGRHFRLSEKFKAIVGRDDPENIKLIEYANPHDLIFDLNEMPGPMAVLKGENPNEEMLLITASIVKRFSKFRDQDVEIRCWQKDHEKDARLLRPGPMYEARLAALKI